MEQIVTEIKTNLEKVKKSIIKYCKIIWQKNRNRLDFNNSKVFIHIKKEDRSINSLRVLV